MTTELSLEVTEIGAGVELVFRQTVSADPAPQSDEQLGSEKSSEKILALLGDASKMTTLELADHLGISQSAVEKQIERLKRDGRLKRIGPDNGGQWQVQTKP